MKPIVIDVNCMTFQGMKDAIDEAYNQGRNDGYAVGFEDGKKSVPTITAPTWPQPQWIPTVNSPTTAPTYTTINTPLDDKAWWVKPSSTSAQ